VRVIIVSGARLGFVGIAAGVAVSLAASRILDGLLFGVDGRRHLAPGAGTRCRRS
jgi:hypothetical protein